MDTLIRCVGVLRVTLYSGERVKCVNFGHLKRSVKLRLSFCSANLQDDYIMFSAQHNPSRLRGKKKQRRLYVPYVAYKVEFSLLCELLPEKRSLCTPLCAKIKRRALGFFPPFNGYPTPFCTNAVTRGSAAVFPASPSS